MDEGGGTRAAEWTGVGLVDSLLGLVISALLITEYVSDDKLSHSQVTIGVATSIGLGALIVMHRRAPLLLAVAVTGLASARAFLPEGGAGVAHGLVIIVAAYSVAAYRDGWVAYTGLALSITFGLVTIAYDRSSWDLGSFLFYGVWVCAPWVVGRMIRLRQQREQALERDVVRLDRVREEEARAAVDEERLRIARELHDVVGHAIGVIVLQADGGRRLLDIDPQETRTALDTIERVGRDALGEMRRLVALMRETESIGALGPQPGLRRLDALATELRAAGLPVEIRIEGGPVALPAGLDLAAYRIVQEALTNTLKHAGPASAQVVIRYEAGSVCIAVIDDGIGPSGNGLPGHGLTGIRERVSVYGGSVEAGPGEQGGYVVRARLPYAGSP